MTTLQLSRLVVLIAVLGFTSTIPTSIAKGDFMIAPGLDGMVNNADLSSPAKKAIEAAQKSIRDRDLASARESLKSLENDPNVAHPEILLAELLAEAGFAADGRNTLEEFSGKEPERVDLYLVFSEIALKQQRWFDGWNLASFGLRAPMPEHWSAAFKKQIRDRLLLVQAICCEGRKDWTGAKKIYATIEQSPKNEIDVLAGLGRTNFHLGDTAEAVSSFQKIKELKPQSEPPYLLMAQLYGQAGKAKEAEEAYKEAYKNAEGDDKVGVRLAFARWLILRNEIKTTSELLTEPINDSPENERERQYLQALVARMQGKYADAQAILSALHRQNPATFAISNQLALVLCESTDESLRARALQIAESNVRNQSQSSEAWATLGWVKFQLGDLKSAEASLANASQLGPLNRDGLYYVLQLKRAAGDANAVLILEKALAEAQGPDYFSNYNAGK
jgi:tetratricopeptide (TPR) repeat protein